MVEIIVSINRNILRVSLVDPKKGFVTASEELTQNVISDTKVIDINTFSEILSNTISKITKLNKNKLQLHFVIEPQDVFLRYVTVNKNGLSVEDQIIGQVKNTLNKGDSLEDMYFSYQKIAPFLYQFVGINKDKLESYLEIASGLGISIKSLIPWVLILPKYVKTTTPSLFFSNRDGRQVMAVSELGGIFFTEVFDKEKTGKELGTLLREIAFYQKDTSINKVYTLNYDNFSIPDFKTTMVELPVTPLDPFETKGYEVNVLVNYFLDVDPTVVNSQTNLLNLLPLPIPVKKNSLIVYAGTTVSILILIAGLYGLITTIGKNKTPDGTDLAQNNQGSQVLGNSTEPAEKPIETKQPDLNKKDISIQVENGSGITGLAARTRDFMKDLGYQIAGIDTAESQVKDTILRFKKDKVQYRDLVSADLKAKFPNIVIEDTLPGSDSNDLVIILGESSKL